MAGIFAGLKRMNDEQKVNVLFDKGHDTTASYTRDGFSQSTLGKDMCYILASPRRPNI